MQSTILTPFHCFFFATVFSIFCSITILFLTFTLLKEENISLTSHLTSPDITSPQTKPSARPKLDAILEHPFYTKSGAFTPTQLPESAMREPPSFSIQRFSGDAFDDKKVQLGEEYIVLL